MFRPLRFRIYLSPLKLTLYLCLLTSMFATPLTAQSEDPSANYRVLEWKELVPEGWEAPIIAPAYDAATAQTVDKASLEDSLDGLVVRLPGYMKPVVFEDRTVTEFLLVPFLPQHVKQHAHLEPNQMVYVALHQGVQVENPFQPVWVTGTLSLETVATDEGPAGYSMLGAQVTEYQ